MICVQPSWITSVSSHQMNKLRRSVSESSLSSLEEVFNDAFNNCKTECAENNNYAAICEAETKSRTSTEMTANCEACSILKEDNAISISNLSTIEKTVFNTNFVNSKKQSITLLCDSGNELVRNSLRKGSVASTTSTGSRGTQQKIKNIIGWVQKNGRRASIKCKTLKRKASLPTQDSSKLRCSEPTPIKCLQDLLCSKEKTQIFRQFLVKEMSEENLDFWLEVEAYKKQKAAKQERIAKKIFQTYIEAFSPCEINIDASTRKQTKENLESPNSTSFDDAQKQIYKLMENDSFRRFSSLANVSC